MRTTPPSYSAKIRPHRTSPGFALVVTLSMMILLTVVAIGLLSLSTISLRTSGRANAQNVARANAKMALMLAIGELQKQTGPDQRVTMTSNLRTGPEPANPNWTGATNVSPAALTPNPQNAAINWLVSGDRPDPTQTLTRSGALGTGNALNLGTYLRTSNTATPGPSTQLLAPVVNVTQGTNRGRFAWWIGDEGTKARVDVANPRNVPATESERLARYQSPLEPGLANLGSAWAAFAPLPAGTIDRTALISMNTTSLAAQRNAITTEFFNDLTTGGFGLPVNVVTGGYKADLSMIFDRSQRNRGYAANYFGAAPSLGNFNGAMVTNFNITNPSRFFLSDTISRNGTNRAGPNWGAIWNYASLWQNVSNQQIAQVGVNPTPETDLRYNNWLPYTNSNNGAWRRDAQHLNTSVSPVLSLLQMSFRLSSELATPATATAAEQYRAQITIQPIMGLWNPYNVAIRAAPYQFQWALYPYFRFNYARPTGTGSFTDSRLTELWLRDEWTDGSSVIPTPDSPGGGRYISLDTDAIDLQPGEFRLFSVTDRVTIRAGASYRLRSGWSERGGFVVNLRAPDGTQRLVPKGHRAWFGDIVLQDTQSPATLARYSSLNPAETASTWFTLKSGNNIILRSTDLWNGDSRSSLRVPEPVVSGSNGGLNTTKTTYLIEDLAGDRVSAHIATWSFPLRTTAQVEEPGQRLRNWVDSNPRAIVTNPLWDGSRVDGSGNRTGWHFTSHLMGVFNPPGRPRQVGDGQGGNRGLLAEGGSSIPEPEVNLSSGRYQGFGGAANTLSAGQNHVILYDIPRSPLISLGQLQHAQLARYNFEPGFVVGNSFANPRIPLTATTNPNFNGINGLTISDISHEVNQKLWDSYFFSSLAPDYLNTNNPSFDAVFNFRRLAAGEVELPNPRMTFAPSPSDTSIDRIISENGTRAPEAIASRILVKGAFNVNSTSKTAWKAVLSSLSASHLPTVNPRNNTVSWNNPSGIRFNRFGHVINSTPYQTGGGGDNPSFWQGWRNISEPELDRLAEEIVNEVKARGPFRSLAEFVNRSPSASIADHQRKGALQAALDRTVNASFPASVGRPATNPPGAQFSPAVSNENQAAGSAAYLMQGDVLQALAPVLQPRSDYFRIRTCGEALDASGNVVARAWCEAYVQRSPEYMEPVDPSFRNATELTSAVNRTFGRPYQVVSFRWLAPSEI